MTTPERGGEGRDRLTAPERALHDRLMAATPDTTTEAEEDALAALLAVVDGGPGPMTGLDLAQHCMSCGRDFEGEDGADVLPGGPCPATDDCPSHWEEIGRDHPMHPR